jgi:urease accessory protein
MKDERKPLGIPLIVAALATTTLPTLAYAHAGFGDVAGFLHGLQHPLGGIDHVLAMIAVGLWAAQRGGRALWLVPASFVLIIAMGGVVGAMNIFAPFAEHGIILSVLLLGLLIAGSVRLSMPASAAIVGLFAMFHGLAHGVEMPADSTGIAYGVGFVLSTAFLHGLGITVALLIDRAARRGYLRLVGAAIAVSGTHLWVLA